MANDDTTPTNMILKELVKNQSLMSQEVKDLAKAISKMDLLMEKFVNIESRHTEANRDIHLKIKEFSDLVQEEIKKFNSCQINGCSALHKTELKIEFELKNIKDDVADLIAMKNKILWGIVSAVGMSLLSLVLKGS